jgi:hypothetical protein
MKDAAQGEPRTHEVFERPFRVEPVYESWKTPGNYREYPGGDKLPGKMKVWLIQNSGKDYGGVVARSWGFEDSPDAEVLTPGFNDGKENGAVGVGRHGNFLQWGFSAPPSQMTDAGRKFFLNCICYIHKFEGKSPLVRHVRNDRMQAVVVAGLVDKIDYDYIKTIFPTWQLKEYKKNPKGLVKYYQDNFERIYWDKVYLVDAELGSLGIESNRNVSSLGRLIVLLMDKNTAGTARLLLERYTEESFKTPGEWKAWFAKNKGRIYFSDVGGYKFRVVPEGYLNNRSGAADSLMNRHD